MFTGCYACGQEGHRRSECPSRAPLPAPAPGLTAAPDQRIPVPVPAEQRCQYGDVNPHAEQLRRQMGWTMSTKQAREIDSRALAAEQVSESRTTRTVLP